MNRSVVRIDDIKIVGVMVKDDIEIVFSVVLGEHLRFGQIFSFNGRFEIFMLLTENTTFVFLFVDYLLLLLLLLPFLFVVFVDLSEVVFFGDLGF